MTGCKFAADQLAQTEYKMRQLLYTKEALATKYIMYFISNLCPPPPLYFLKHWFAPTEIFS